MDPLKSRIISAEFDDFQQAFSVSLEDRTWEVLPAILKKYRIEDLWHNYAIMICYGPPDRRKERCIGLDEKPLIIFQGLKASKKDPVLMLRHIGEIQSPIVSALQKGDARTDSTAATHSSTAEDRIEINLDELELAEFHVTLRTPESPSVASYSRLAGTTFRLDDDNENSNEFKRDSVDDLSYAVAIYPYMAQHEDETDVEIGDMFVVVAVCRGWRIVQRDLTGSGVFEDNPKKQSLVPASCLLEINLPACAAFAEAYASRGSGKLLSSTSPSPILPSSIISINYPGVALIDYEKRVEEEITLKRDDALRIVKRYEQWAYVVKENGGDRGWVPAWFLGRDCSAN